MFKKSFEELLKISRLFVAFESLEEIASEFYIMFKENKFKLQEESDKILLFISLIVNERKTHEICFEILQLEIKKDDLLNDLCTSVNQIKNNLASVTEKLDKFETKMKQLIPCETIDLIDKEFLNTIKQKISSNKIKFKLLYKATVNGDNSQAFHSCCDYKSPTLVVVQTIKDVVFGGYTSVVWDQSNSYKSDSTAFIFSNNLKKIYTVSNNIINAIYSKNSSGPTFGSGHDFYIRNDCLSSNSNYVNFNGYSNGSGYELNNNEYNFTVKELEVYSISIFSNK